jgi:hypothetical protein
MHWRSFFFVAAIAWTSLACASQDFTATSSAVAILQALSPVHAEITRRIQAQGSLENAGVGVKLPVMTDRDREYILEDGYITTAGTIVAHNSKYHVLVVLEPLYKTGVVSWTCKVVPESSAPRACR